MIKKRLLYIFAVEYTFAPKGKKASIENTILTFKPLVHP